MTPASTTYHGEFDLYATTAPSQAWGIIEALNILEACVPTWYPGQSLATLGPASPQFWHALIETKKLVYSDTYAHNADPDVVSVPVAMLTSKSYAASLCGKVDPAHAGPTIPPSFDPAPAATAAGTIGGDTIYLTTADRWGNMVSWINSNFAGFGSGITVPVRLHSSQPGRLVHAGSKEPQRHRASQAAVQHALGGVRHAERQALVDDRPARR